MKKNTTKNTVLFMDDNGIIIRLDTKFAKEFKKKNHKECIALKEEKMGYGIIITQDEEIGVYAKDDLSRIVLSNFWDMQEDRIHKDIVNAKDIDELIQIAIQILSSCTMSLIISGAENIEDVKRKAIELAA